MDSFGGFGGVGASVLSFLSDEYSSKSRLTFAVTPTNTADKVILNIEYLFDQQGKLS